MSDVMPLAVVAAGGLIGAAWVMSQGAIVGASAEVEGKSTVWGSALNAFGGFMVVISLFFGVVVLGGIGGDNPLIPTTAWPLLMGAFTMIGAGFAAALCVMVAAKAGAEMITQKPELSIWSLLFIALGEGLAIYGLIITILMISK
jgi:F0F1-type ATP synthase membrane subunit c/vacuolar-type H+-ATPase subunit K